MRVVGIDPASGRCGVAVVDFVDERHEKPEFVDVFAFDSAVKDKAAGARARSMQLFAQRLRQIESVNLVMIGCSNAFTGNTRTVRLIAYYEAVALLWAAEIYAEVILLGDGTARRIVLGSGGIAKADVYDVFMEIYGNDWPWGEKGAKGTDDKIDAGVFALAGPTRLREIARDGETEEA